MATTAIIHPLNLTCEIVYTHLHETINVITYMYTGNTETHTRSLFIKKSISHRCWLGQALCERILLNSAGDIYK